MKTRLEWMLSRRLKKQDQGSQRAPLKLLIAQIRSKCQKLTQKISRMKIAQGYYHPLNFGSIVNIKRSITKLDRASSTRSAT